MSYFSDNYQSLLYPVFDNFQKGLRDAQIGAIHAIASHAILNPIGIAIVVMPTGSGKTAVFMMAPYVLRKTKVLIVTPNVITRSQIANDYKTLLTLKKIGVFNSDIEPPIVFEAKTLVDKISEDDVNKANVVVASYEAGLSISNSDLRKKFDYLIIDEAHHIPSPTCQNILKNMTRISALLFTATPFRLDKKHIQGHFIFNYPLSRAIDDHIFGKIEYIPVVGDYDDKDILIAQKAEETFNNDHDNNYNHYLMVRTDSRKNAKKLEDLYNEKTKLNLKRIDSSMALSTINKVLKELKEGKINGIICVDMLGEGFDFPNLKIAAIHETQKSLTSCLQFIGRFARTNAKDIGTAKFIAFKDDFLKDSLKPFSDNAGWQDMIISISEKAIENEINNNNKLNDFLCEKNDINSFSLTEISINCHARVYKASEFNINANFPENIMAQGNIYRDEESNTVIGISKNDSNPLWLKSLQKYNTSLSIYVIHYQKDTKLLFIYSEEKTEAMYELLAKAFCTRHEKIPRNEMNRVLANFKDYSFFNTGMQNRYVESGESYRICAGSNTASSINETTGMMVCAGHAFCKVYNSDESTTTIGYSSGSKFWSNKFLTLKQYIEWCDEYGHKIKDGKIRVKTDTNYDKLPMPSKITEYKDVFFCFFNEEVYSHSPKISIENQKIADSFLYDSILKVIRDECTEKQIAFSLTINDETDIFTCDINGKYKAKNKLFSIVTNKDEKDLSDYFNDNPLVFKTCDDVVYCGFEVLEPKQKIEDFDKKQIDFIEWDKENADINVEVANKKYLPKDGKKAIHDVMKEYLKNSKYNYSYIIYDHGSGEIADFITFNYDDSNLYIEFYHCKAMKAKSYNSSVSDVYEVAQQAIKSTIWAKDKYFLWDKIDKRISGSMSKMIKGTYEDLKQLFKSKKHMECIIYIVQPSLSKSAPLTDSVGRILSAASFYISQTGVIKELRIKGSR